LASRSYQPPDLERPIPRRAPVRVKAARRRHRRTGCPRR
jgi:hypothetical protein